MPLPDARNRIGLGEFNKVNSPCGWDSSTTAPSCNKVRARDTLVARVVFTEYLKFLAVWVRTHLEDDPERASVARLVSGGSPVKRQLIAEPVWR